MLTRTRPVTSVPSPALTELSLPGLVSSLRPIKRVSAQISDELNLIHRFTYKNKNQHKASAWWKRLVHVDRALNRTLQEVESLLSQFGSTKDTDEFPKVDSSQVIKGLLQLPRSLILVEKSTQVLLNCASILEQLIETKAFLAFILVVVSLVARLHSLSLVLHDELTKLNSVLVHLVESNKLSSIADPMITRLPKQLRSYIVPSTVPAFSAPPPLPANASPPPTAQNVSLGATDDDLGAVIVRKAKPSAKEETTRDSPTKKQERLAEEGAHEVEVRRAGSEAVEEGTARPLSLKRKKTERQVKAGERAEKQEEEGLGGTSLLAFTRDAKRNSQLEKVDRLAKKRGLDGDEKPKKKKKKKESRGLSTNTDEIDAIFG